MITGTVRSLIVVVVLSALYVVVQPPLSAADLPLTVAGNQEPLDASGLLDALADEGVAVPNPLDTTAQECPMDGCEQSIVTDTMRIKSFATVAQAEWYAATRGLPWFANIVVQFAPPLSVEQREADLAAIGRLLP